MKYLFTAILLSFSFSILAGKPKVLIVDPDVDSSSLEKDYDVQRPAHHYALPDKEVRNEVMSDIKAVDKYDELQKDILFMDLKKKTMKDLKAKYSDISESDLKKMLGRMSK